MVYISTYQGICSFGWLDDWWMFRIWNEEAMAEVVSGHLAGGTENFKKSRIAGVSAEVQTEHFPNSIRSVVKIDYESVICTCNALKK